MVSEVDVHRKHSSGDLHSRLKSRKLLGVGETDDGDIHRSKLSQILGHSDQLYVRLPHGLRIWQFILGLMFTLIALWALIFPATMFEMALMTDENHYQSVPVRLYGSSLLSLSWMFWSSLHAVDRDVIRASLMCSIIYFSLQTIVTSFAHLIASTISKNSGIFLGYTALSWLISTYYYWAVGCKLMAMRRSNSNKDIAQKEQ